MLSKRSDGPLFAALMVILIGLFVLACCGLFTMLITYAMIRTDCSNIHNATGLETKWTPVSGCFIHTEGGWIPRDSWNGVQFLN